MNDSPLCPAIMMFGGSPMSVAVPPMFAATTSMITSGSASISEAITNAVRHARASRIDLTLGRTADDVELTVADDGVGIPDTAELDAHGIAGMRERALLAGGRLTLSSGPEEGTRVCLLLPLDGAAAG